jgi:hypothetical protein
MEAISGNLKFQDIIFRKKIEDIYIIIIYMLHWVTAPYIVVQFHNLCF